MICKDGRTALFSFLFASVLFICLLACDAFYFILLHYSKNKPYVFVLFYLIVINVVFRLLYKAHDYQVSNFNDYLIKLIRLKFYCRLQCVL